MTKTAIRRPEKTRKIVAIAEKLFLEKGYAETTIDDILEATWLSKGGFYHYFNSNEEVLSESIKTLMQDILAALLPIIEDERLTSLDKLKLFMSRKADFQQTPKGPCKIFKYGDEVGLYALQILPLACPKLCRTACRDHRAAKKRRRLQRSIPSSNGGHPDRVVTSFPGVIGLVTYYLLSWIDKRNRQRGPD